MWSKYLLIVLLLIIIFLDLVLFQSIFGKMSFYFKIILFYALCLAFLLLIILINTASLVSFEVKKCYKLLNKLFITSNKQRITNLVKINIWIERNHKYMNFLSQYFLNFLYSCYYLLRESQRKTLDFIVGKYLCSTVFVYMK